MKVRFFRLLWLTIFCVSIGIAMSSCGDDDSDDPKNEPALTSQQSIVGTWKGVWKDYTGVRDELMTAHIYGDGETGSIEIWWTHYLNMDQYYFTGKYVVSNNKLTLKGKYGIHRQTPNNEYNKTVSFTCKDDVLKFYFDCDNWILTKR